MSIDLAPRVRDVLKRVKNTVAQKQRAERKAQTDAMQQLLSWCDRHELETQSWFGRSKVVFDQAVLARIEQTLSELNLFSLDVDLSDTSRLTQAQGADAEYKGMGLAPMERRVLIAQANCGAYFPEWVNESPSQWVMDIDWQTLQLSEYAYVLMVENRDMFYQYFALHPQHYTLPPEALAALVIYRGDGDESKGCKALREACLAQGKPLVYFGDYDNAGLNFAVNGGYTHILLPQHAYLLARANDMSQDAKQVQLAPSVIAFAQQLPDSDPLKALLLYNAQQQKGLRQQGFQGPLQLLPI
ncbi:MAG TPA: hypothetical protein VJY83_08335, partial [Thiopseudomonas sp.]|nr:hypothetical protein [Thiopseudomonas sp.]